MLKPPFKHSSPTLYILHSLDLIPCPLPPPQLLRLRLLQLMLLWPQLLYLRLSASLTTLIIDSSPTRIRYNSNANFPIIETVRLL